jgi:hypothetical protein
MEQMWKRRNSIVGTFVLHQERSKTVKKLTLITMLFVLFLGTRCQALESAKAAFFGKHECHAAGSHAQRCRIKSGDTLSKDALAVYGDWRLYSTILMGANPSIVDANKIYASSWIIIPDAPTLAPVTTTTAEVAPKEIASAPAAVTMEDDSSTLPSLEVFANMPAPVVRLAPAQTQIVIAVDPKVSANIPATTADVAKSFAPASVPTSAKMERTKQAKVSGYQSAVSNNPNLRGPLQTQLILFDSEEEKKLGLPCGSCRIDLKPSLAIPANDGSTVVFVHLKKLPAQPFVLLVGGINHPIDSTEIRAYRGKTPGTHVFARTMASIGKMGAPGAVSFFVGGPILTTCVVGIPQLVKLGVAWHDKAHERTLAAAQAAVDKSKLALYRATTESNTLATIAKTKEILQ